MPRKDEIAAFPQAFGPYAVSEALAASRAGLARVREALSRRPRAAEQPRGAQAQSVWDDALRLEATYR